jgi:hypothetical protein
VFHILVAVPTGDGFTVMRGGVYSFYEFLEPGRLSDQDWRARIEQDKLPARPIWARNFEVDETMATVLTECILGFNNAITLAFWLGNIEATPPDNPTEKAVSFLTGAELADTQAFIEQMKARKQFIGMKRLAMEFRSFDINDRQATVTTRERWNEKTYPGSVYELIDGPPAPIREREYTADVTYTLELQGDTWLISKIVVDEQP